MLKTLGALAVGAYATPALATEQDFVKDYGARRPTHRPRSPRFYQKFATMRGISTKAKNVFLWKNYEKELGNEIEPHWQGPARDAVAGFPVGAPGEGDCVGHAGAMAGNVIAASDIHFLKESEKFVAPASVEAAYWGSRFEAGGGKIKGRAGSRGEWMARFYRDWGVLHQLEYEKDGKKIDLRGYHPSRSRQYRDSGVPDWLEGIAREHPVKEYTNVTSGKEALDAVCSGQPVIMCSSYAFRPERDAQGFCAAYGEDSYKRGWRWITVRKQWWHAMVLTGALLEGGRVGGLIQNSHGDWNEGPRPFDIPRGSFFVDLNTLDLMCKDWGDCWAISSYHGHQAKRIRRKIKLY